MNRFLTLSALAAALACGSNSGSSNAATSHNNAGGGSNTLLVTADIAAVTTTATPPAPQTTFTVTVKDGAGANVSGATVAVRNASVADGVVNLTEVTGTPGRYTATLASFPSGDFQLSVVKGTDSVLGVVVGGPGMHTITAPALNATVTAGQPLDVTWSTPAVAKQVSVTTRDMSITAPDTGVYSLTAAQNPARLNQRVTVVRTNEVEAAGGLLGSRMNVTYTAQINPYNVQ